MDFSTFNPAEDAETGARMEIIDPRTGEPFRDEEGNPVWIELRGAESEAVKAAARSHSRALMKAKTNEQRVKMAEKNGFDMLVAATKAWSPAVAWEGKPLACTPDNARMLYQSREFIARQVVEFMADEANFLPKAPRS